MRLVKTLPMKDAFFTSDLASKGLFPGDLEEDISEQGTRANRAKYFIKRIAEIGNTDSFLKLLAAMEEYSSGLKELADEIKAEFPDSLPSKYVLHSLYAQKYSIMYSYV